MNCTKNQKLFVPLLLAGSLAFPSFAQDTGAPKTEAKPGGQPDEAQMMAAMMELAKPGDNHKLLQGLAGSWTYSGKFWMSPDPTAPPELPQSDQPQHCSTVGLHARVHGLIGTERLVVVRGCTLQVARTRLAPARATRGDRAHRVWCASQA